MGSTRHYYLWRTSYLAFTLQLYHQKGKGNPNFWCSFFLFCFLVNWSPFVEEEKTSVAEEWTSNNFEMKCRNREMKQLNWEFCFPSWLQCKLLLLKDIFRFELCSSLVGQCPTRGRMPEIRTLQIWLAYPLQWGGILEAIRGRGQTRRPEQLSMTTVLVSLPFVFFFHRFGIYAASSLIFVAGSDTRKKETAVLDTMSDPEHQDWSPDTTATQHNKKTGRSFRNCHMQKRTTGGSA